MNRRTFVKSATALAAFNNLNFENTGFFMEKTVKNIRITSTDSNFKRENLVNPLGFKGGYLSELWQTAVKMKSASGNSEIGIATQSVLYGDADLFSRYSEAGGNALMFALTEKALELVKKTSFSTPVELMENIMQEVMVEGRRMTGMQDLNENFAYNALVSVDNAAWLLYASENGFENFDAMIPVAFQQALSHHNNKIAVIYAVPYGMSMADLKKGVQEGYFIFKIKTGFPGTQEEMLQKDMERLTQLHNVLKDVRTEQTANGKLIYTLDANGRYEKKESLLRYMEHAKKIGAFEQILFYEEPLNSENEEDVSDVGVRIAADESIHDEASALRRIEQGYAAFVLKGIAKTLSNSMKIARLAYKKEVPCLCADLTVNPILLDWHKNLAARLTPFPGLGMGLMETNGAMNYKHWQTMQNYHPRYGSSWTTIRNGIFELNENFYEHSGGIFDSSDHYQSMFRNS